MKPFFKIGLFFSILFSLSVSSIAASNEATLLIPLSHQNQAKPNETDKTFDIGSISNIINQLFNKTSKPTAGTSTTPSPTNGTTVAPPCQCGKGGTPKVNLRQSDVEVGQSEDDLNDFDLSDLVADHKSKSRMELEDKYTEDNDTRIFHGVASNSHAYPWMAAIINGFVAPGSLQPNLLCGGSLINSQYVVTAAHCFGRFANSSAIIKNISLILGTNSIAPSGTKVSVRITAVTIHPKFNKTTFDNDITLLKLAVPITFTNNIRPICLSQAGAPFPNRKVIVAGWGSTNANGTVYPTFLREAGGNTITNAACKTRATFSTGITGNMICAVGASPAPNSNACFGDSGGPLMIFKPTSKTFSLIGLTSNGAATCNVANQPVVYTRVASYISFIKSVTNGTSFCSNSFT